MRAAWLRIGGAGLLASLVFGCGGGNNASSPTPTPTPTTSNTSITVSFTGGPPQAAAVQIGTGPWMPASLTNGQLNLTVPAGTSKYGIAIVCGSPSFERLVEATVQDGTNYSVQCSGGPVTATVTGNVDATAIANTVNVVINAPDVFPVTVNGTSGAFTLTNVFTGKVDIAALAEDSSGNVLAVKIVRSQTIPGPINGGNPITFAAGDAITTTQPVSLINVPAGYNVGVGGSYVTANGTGFSLSPNSTQPANQYAVVPASEAQSGDFYSFTANALQGTTLLDETFQTSTTVGPANVSLPPPWSSTVVSPAEFPTFTFNYTGLSSQPAVALVAQIEWLPMSPGLGSSIAIFATANFQAGSNTMTVPDLTGLPGFNPMATSGTVVTWIVAVYGGTEQPYKWFAGPEPANGSLSFVSINGTYTEP